MELSVRGEMAAQKRIYTKDSQGRVNENFIKMCRRVANFLGNNKEEKEEFFWVMSNLYFLPNSPCLVNAGVKGRKNQLSACFVLTVPDSIEGIYDTIKETALIHKTGGGTGFSFSNIRPTNSMVSSTSGIASGPVSFMRVFDASTEGIKQGGVRRGANMGVLRVDHPDIMEFISCKRGKNALHNFNISVAITDDFMEAVLKNTEYELVNPHTKEKSPMSAKKVFDTLIDNAWFTGDPGVIFIDRIEEHNPLDGEENKIEATNPCVTGDTLVLTEDGYIRIDELVGNSINIWNGYRFSKVTPRITGVNQQILSIKFSNGSHLKCTPYHEFETKQGRIQAKDLEIGTKLSKWKLPIIEGATTFPRKYAYTLGFFCGDGSQETTRERNSIWLYDEKCALLDYLEYERYNTCGNGRLFVKMNPSVFNKTLVLDTNYSVQTRLDYLAGLIDSNGTTNSSEGSITLWSSDYQFITKVKHMIETLGSNCSIDMGTRGGQKSMPDGRGGHALCDTQPCYRLVISSWNVRKLSDLGLVTHRVSVNASPNRDAARAIKVVSIEEAPMADAVYCFTEPYNHTAVFNGVMTGQCGEQPLSNHEACGLGSINLSLMTKDFGIDYALLEQVASIGTRFLNRMMHKSDYPNEDIHKRVLDSRKIGLGIMGWADMLLKMRIPYSSQDALEIAETVATKILDAAVMTNHELGTKEEVFPLFKQYVMPAHIRDSLKRLKIAPEAYKPAHSTLLTIAPTGTISMLADCSSGCEPVFKFEQKENRVDSTYTYTHPIYAAFKTKFPKAELPPYFETADEIDPDHHIYTQATFQKYICSAVSKTVNLPNSATKSEVEKVYKEAFLLGCKGVTVYRDGCLDNQVLSDANASNEYIKPQVRPKSLSGSTHQIKTGYGEMLITINYKDNEPFEVICQLGKSGASEMAKAESISRLVSMLLRCRVHVKTIIDQLEGIVGSAPVMTEYGLVKSISDALAKVLIHHVLGREQHNEAIPAMMKCEDCGKSEFLFREGSCINCSHCGWKSCGG